MVAMTVPDVWRDPDRLLTVDDLEDLFPDDDRRLELDDGVLIVSAFAANIHQLVVARLTALLTAACPDHLVVLPGVGMRITQYQYREPDVAVVPVDSFDVRNLESPPPLVVEVASPSTRLTDRNRKKDVYEAFGIPAYWIVGPDRGRPRLTAFELRGGAYEQVADVTGTDQFRAAQPFGVSIRPATLVTTGPLG
jgi:Uma2 family endonuclease